MSIHQHHRNSIDMKIVLCNLVTQASIIANKRKAWRVRFLASAGSLHPPNDSMPVSHSQWSRNLQQPCFWDVLVACPAETCHNPWKLEIGNFSNRKNLSEKWLLLFYDALGPRIITPKIWDSYSIGMGCSPSIWQFNRPMIVESGFPLTLHFSTFYV
jgi:hypothetical protein